MAKGHLLLRRKVGESIEIAGEITITIMSVRGDKVSLSIRAPENITVHRSEIAKRISDDEKTNLET